MARMELTLTVLLAASCLASIRKPIETQVSPLCQDLDAVYKLNIPNGTELQYYGLLQACEMSASADTNPDDAAEKAVDRIARCGKMQKLEQGGEVLDLKTNKELINCILEVDCYKRFYMEEANLSLDVYPTQFPLVWRGKEVVVDSPPKDTFDDATAAGAACAKFADHKPPPNTATDQDKPSSMYIPKMVNKEVITENNPPSVTENFKSFFSFL